jgi:hypothetical protein
MNQLERDQLELDSAWWKAALCIAALIVLVALAWVMP